ncbi:MAG: VOC family protein [Pseudomonadota bacterium]
MKLHQPTPELPVADVKAAQVYYRDAFGFEVGWYNELARKGAVFHGDCAIFFQETAGPITPVVLWIFSENVDEAYENLVASGADIVSPLKDTPWGLRQFTVQDGEGHHLHIFVDL